jgi:HEAT repeat protein
VQVQTPEVPAAVQQPSEVSQNPAASQPFSALSSEPSAPQIYSPAPAPDQRAASGLGLASLTLGLFVALLGLMGIFLLAARSSWLAKAIGPFYLSYGIVAGLLLSPLGFVLGIVGLFQSNRRHAATKVGIAVNGVALALIIAIPILEHVANEADKFAREQAQRVREQAAREEALRQAEAERLAREEEEKRRAARQAEEQRMARERADKEEAARIATVQSLVLLPGALDVAKGDASKWADASCYAVQQGPVRVSIQRVQLVGKQLEIRLLVQNISPSKIDVARWSEATGLEKPVLKDPKGETFDFLRANSNEARTFIPAQKELAESLRFAGPVLGADSLQLELPASVFAGTGQLRLEIPRPMLLVMTALDRGRTVVPEVTGLLEHKNPNIRIEAAQALASFGSDQAVQALLKALKDPLPAVQAMAAAALARIGPRAHQALAQLVQSCASENEEVRTASQTALQQIGPLTREDVPVIMAGLKDPNAAIRRGCLLALLAGPGPAAIELLPVLLESAKDEDLSVRAGSLELLGRLSKESRAGLPVLLNSLGDPEEQARKAAAEALTKYRPFTKADVPVLIAAAKDGKKAVRRRVIELLIELAPTVEEATPPVIAALQDDDDTVVELAADAVDKSKKLSKAHVPGLAGAIKNTKGKTRLSAIVALGNIGPEARDTIPLLVECLKDSNAGTRQEAVLALGKIGEASWKESPAIARLLQDKELKVRQNAARALEMIGPSAFQAVPDLLKAWRENDLRDDATKALVRIGKGSVSNITQTITDTRDVKVRIALIDILGQIGPDAKDSTTFLTKLAIEDMNLSVRKAAKEALAKVKSGK